MQNIFITGANRGIGLGFAWYYLTHEARVFAGCRTPQQAARLKELQAQYGDKLVIVPLEVTDEDSIRKAQQMISGVTDRLDVVINNAGVLHTSHNLSEVTTEGLSDSFAVNAIAPMMVAKHFAALLQAGDTPKLVNITMPTPPITKWTRTENHAYIASRYATNALTKMLALELGSKGIITVALHPGYLQTDMNHYSAEAVPVEAGIGAAAGVIDGLTMEQNGLCFLSNGNAYDW
jgi:NAD(P)-dependent dehydrogenase (short-subunit alcohol dehydrogenase family)